MSDWEEIYKVEDVDGDRRTWETWYTDSKPSECDGREIIPGAFVPHDSDPCPWELQPAPPAVYQGGDAVPDGTNLERLRGGGCKYCPGCGRRLGSDNRQRGNMNKNLLGCDPENHSHFWSFMRDDIPNPPHVPFCCRCDCGDVVYLGVLTKFQNPAFREGFKFGLAAGTACGLVAVMMAALVSALV